MTDSIPPWLANMREITGTQWAHGDGSNPTIIGWLNFIGSAYPNMADYCNSVVHDDYFSWCGLTVGYCLAKAGIPPLFGSTDTSRFLWAAGWLGWGNPVTSPQPGDVLVFDFGGGDHHVTLFEKDNGNGTWACLGGNQSHRVMLTNFPKRSLMGIRRPNVIGAVVQPQPVPAPLRAPSQRFATCVALVLRDEGGNDDDPRDRGGRTSRGITQGEWDAWRASHPGLPSDVWQAPQDQILAIYHQNYWSVVRGDDLPAGVDYAVFDYGVNSGDRRAAKVLQGFVGADVDGEIGPQTIAATSRADPSTLIKQICDERLAFLQGLPTWSTFGRGWTRRVDGVRTNALAMVTRAVPAPVPLPVPAPVPFPAPMPAPAPSPSDAVLVEILRRLSLLENGVNSINVTPAPAPPPAPAPTPVPAPSPARPTVAGVDPTALLQWLANAGMRLPQAVNGNGAPILSPIDKVLGGEALVGLKTPAAIVAYALMYIMQAAGVVTAGTPASQAVTAAIAALGGLGLTAKVDRAVKAMTAVAAKQNGGQPAAPPQ